MEQKQERKRKGRRAYLDDFHKDLSGQYVYDGPLYGYVENGKSRKRLLQELWGLCALVMGAVIGVGFTPAPGVSSWAFVVLPYAVSLVGAVSILWAVAQLATGKDPMREYIYEASVEKIPLRALLTAIAAIVSFVGEAVFVILYGAFGRGWYVALALALMAAEAVGALLIRRCMYHADWKVVRRRGESGSVPKQEETEKEQSRRADAATTVGCEEQADQ